MLPDSKGIPKHRAEAVKYWVGLRVNTVQGILVIAFTYESAI